MNDADLLRNRSVRLFNLAAQACQNGLSDYADVLETLAREVVRHTVAVEGRSHTGSIISPVKWDAKDRAH